MDLGIEGRVALVTGASRGLGRASAEALAIEGAKVVVCARGEESLLTTISSFHDMGLDIEGLVCDISSPNAATRLVDHCVDRFGKIDILVANSEGPHTGRSWDVTEEDLLIAFNANMLAHFRLANAAIGHMREAEWGRICSIASHSIMQAMPALGLSNMARSALWGWVKGAAYDLQTTGVTFNLLCPGRHKTDRHSGKTEQPTKDVGDPIQFGRLVAYLCSEHAAFINGTAIAVNGGSTLAL